MLHQETGFILPDRRACTFAIHPTRLSLKTFNCQNYQEKFSIVVLTKFYCKPFLKL